MLFWPNSGPEQAAGTTTTHPLNSSVPWVDRTTPVDEELEAGYVLLATRVADMQEWLEEVRGLEFRESLDLVLLDDADFEAWDRRLQDSKDYWPEYDAVPPLLGIGEPVVSPDEFWSYSYWFEGTILIPKPWVAEEIDYGALLIHDLAGALLDDHFRVGERLNELLRSGVAGDKYDVARLLAEGEGRFLTEGFGWFMAAGDWDPASLPCIREDFNPSPVSSLGRWYVCRLFASGGWPAVDDAHRNPPQSTAEILGIACDPGEVIPTRLTASWTHEVFAAERGALWFHVLTTLRTAGPNAPNSWCFDHQRVVERADGARMFVMDIWVATSADAEQVADAANSVFRNAENDVEHLVARDGTWVGVASTLDGVDLCAELPGWCEG